MLHKKDKEILEHLIKVYPEEGCGLLLNKKGKLVWVPTENIAENKFTDFIVSPKDYIKAQLSGDIFAIVHSHPDAPCEPSEQDKRVSDFLGIPYYIYSLPSMDKFEYIPNRAQSSLLGREYLFGTNDCYSLVRDYYKQKLSIDLPTIPFEDNWWEKGLNYFDDLYESFGFTEVDTPKEHDFIIFNVYSDIPNHCGIYLGEDVFMHHAESRLSCRESLFSGWNKHVKRYTRCKQFI